MDRHKTQPFTSPQPVRVSGSDRGPMKVSELMGDDPVIELDHEGQIYRLRITRNRKLILTK